MGGWRLKGRKERGGAEVNGALVGPEGVGTSDEGIGANWSH